MSWVLPVLLLVIPVTLAFQDSKNLQFNELSFPATSLAICKPFSQKGQLNSSACAVVLNVDGEIEEINPAIFVEVYQNFSESQRQHISDLVGKYQQNHTDAHKAHQIKRLVEYEQIIIHTKKITEVQSNPIFFQETDDKQTNHIENLEASIKELGPQVKLSPTKAYEKLSVVSSLPKKFPNAIGKNFLPQILINGVLQNDIACLARLGSRIGYEMRKNSTKRNQVKQINQASKTGQVIKTLGEMSGPIGDTEDIGLSIWSMQQSIKQTTEYSAKEMTASETYDYFWDLFNYVGAILTAVLSAAFPPAAPYLAAGFAILNGLLYAGSLLFQLADYANEVVAQIHAIVPMNEKERKEIFENTFLGNTAPDYKHYLVQEKQANNLAVQNTLVFLERNPQILGVVFPSRTLHVDGNCELWRQHCRARMAGGRCLSGQREDFIRLASKCEWNRPCWGTTICAKFTKDVAKRGRDYYECRCSGDSSNVFGEPRQNSFVDFRNKQDVYWERAVPDDVANGVFQCKPGNKGFVDHKVSNDDPTYDYLCENAIGLLQPSRLQKPGQTLLFNLEDGNDNVYLSKESLNPPNMFAMGNDGTKTFEGGGGRNEFIFNSNCTKSLRGRFHGGPSNDAIVLGDYCGKSQPITVDLKTGTITSSADNLNMNFASIEEVFGRENQKDVVQAACSTKQVIGRNGESSDILDEVIIPEDSSCQYNISIALSKYTQVTSKAQNGQIVLPILGQPAGLKFDLDVYSSTVLNTTILFLNNSASQVTWWKFTNSSNRLELGIGINSAQTQLSYTFKSGAEKVVSIYFTETPTGSPNSVLYARYSGDRTFYHALPQISGSLQRVGSSSTKNIFDVYGGTWNVIGGSEDDEFILHKYPTGTLDGKAGSDTIRIHQDSTGFSTIDLSASEFKSIEKVVGIPGIPLSVHTTCNTELVATRGGQSNAPDFVTIPDTSCGQNSMNSKVLASGYVSVEVRGNVTDKNVVQILADGTVKETLNFELVTKSDKTQNLFVNIRLNHTNLRPTLLRRNVSQQNATVKLTGQTLAEEIRFVMKDLNDTSQSVYFPSPNIQFTIANSQPGIMVFVKTTLIPKMFYKLDGTETTSTSSALGLRGIENVFHIATSGKPWTAVGGEMNDMFILVALPDHQGAYFVNGGISGENTLLLQTHEEDSRFPFLIDLPKEKLGFLAQASKMPGRIQNIQNIIGRTNTPDTIYATCNSKTVNGRGGNAYENGSDVIIIASNHVNCRFNMTILTEDYTHVQNLAQTGKFFYSVSDLTTSSIELSSSFNSTHHFQFSFNPWEQIIDISFNQTTQQMTWVISNGKLKRTQAFSMSQSSPHKDYDNPVFQFESSNTHIKSDIRVGSEGTTYSTVVVNEPFFPERIQGLPVTLNRFLINITTASNDSGGVIEGCSGSRKCSANQFWIFSLETNLEVLDGGSCLDKNCKNYLQFSELLNKEKIFVHLDVCNGYITNNDERSLVSRLQNFHRFHGTQNTTAYATCDTKQVSGTGKIIITARPCHFDVFIALEEYTAVIFEEPAADQYLSRGTINYNFSTAMSFDPQGSVASMLNFNHNYHLPFNLSDIKAVRFDTNTQRLLYKFNNVAYNHSMFFPLTLTDQFYAQPNLITRDKYRLQVARDGSVWIALGEVSAKHNATTLPQMVNLANSLESTLMIKTEEEFYHLAGSTNLDQHNVLQNMANCTSHLAGGGKSHTIYEILKLEHDVIIYTGFEETNSRNVEKKQTIDLSNVVIPIRLTTQTKYVPEANPNGDYLVISMCSHEDKYPGRIFIANGTKPWIFKRLQLLLSNSLMDLVQKEQQSNNSLQQPSFLNRWFVRPQPLKIPHNTTIYSISTEDLEDGQKIMLEGDPSGHLNDSKFVSTRNGDDLCITNLVSPGALGLKTVLINNFFLLPNTTEVTLRETSVDVLSKPPRNSTNVAMPKGLSNVTVNFPDLFLNLDDLLVKQGTTKQVPGFVGGGFNAMDSLDSILRYVEETLLEGMPDVPRKFQDINKVTGN